MIKNFKVFWASLSTKNRITWILTLFAIVAMYANWHINFYPNCDRYNNVKNGFQQFRDEDEITSKSNAFNEIVNILVEQVNKGKAKKDKIKLKDITKVKRGISGEISGLAIKTSLGFRLTLIKEDEKKGEISISEVVFLELASKKYLLNQFKWWSLVIFIFSGLIMVFNNVLNQE